MVTQGSICVCHHRKKAHDGFCECQKCECEEFVLFVKPRCPKVTVANGLCVRCQRAARHKAKHIFKIEW